jgi:hypothetical protein
VAVVLVDIAATAVLDQIHTQVLVVLAEVVAEVGVGSTLPGLILPLVGVVVVALASMVKAQMVVVDHRRAGSVL